jgi:predicted nucleic acid-binding Zn ribbon protein
MVWKDFKCRDCGGVQENVSSRPEDKERACSCGGTAKVVLTPKATKFKGGGWTTPRHVETFPGESENPEDWNAESHGVAGSLGRGIESQDADW